MSSSRVMSRREFSARMATLRVCYPQRIVDDAWATLVPVYYEGLAHYPVAVLRRAIDEASRVHPDWFPTRGQLDVLCQRYHRAQSAVVDESSEDDLSVDYDANIAQVRALLSQLGDETSH